MRAAIGVVVLLLSVPSVAQSQVIPRAAEQFRRPLIVNVRTVWGLTAPVAVFAAQVHQESGWRADAQSAYAAGLTQFTAATAQDIARRFPQDLGEASPFGGADAFNPAWALRALARYDKSLYDLEPRAATDCDRWALTLSAYNGGRGWVIKQKAAAAAAGSDPTRWFGHVERHRVRAAWAHGENTMYPRRILLQRQPLYLSWGLGVTCEVT